MIERQALTPTGTELPIRNVRFHGESWRVSRRAMEIAETTFMTHCGHKQGRNTAAQQSPAARRCAILSV